MHKFGMIALIGPPNAGKSTLMNTYLCLLYTSPSPRD